MAQNHQLAAIMFADIAGFTALMQTDEVLALSFREKLKRKLESVIRVHIQVNKIGYLGPEK